LVISHVIFDFDGVLIDSEDISMKIDRSLLAANGVDFSEAEMHRRFVGKTFEDMVREVETEFTITLPADLSDIKDRRMLEIYRADLRPVPGVVPMLEKLHLPRSIGTNGPRDRALEALRLTGLDKFFGAHITTFEDVENGKPAPDIYLLAARRAGFAPGQCLVVEDSPTGAIGALKAGCRVVGFTGVAHHPESKVRDLTSVGVRTIIHDIAELLDIVSPISA
jgi:HAD superfamily hydrolase (TIGR01509 family)